MHVYLLEMPRSGNKPSSLYIGQRSKSPEESTDYWGSGIFCRNYQKKHGKTFVKENVKKTILLRDLPNQDALNYWEIFAIADYKDRFGDRVVNISDGGETCANVPKSKKQRAIFSEVRKKMWECDEYRTKMKKIHESPECRAKKSKAAKKRWERDEYRAKMEKRNKSPEFKTKQSKAYKKKWECDEYRAKMKKIMESPEFRTKQSDAKRGKNSPSYDINSVEQILKRILAGEGVRIPRTSFDRALRNAEHKKHTEYMELFNKYQIKEK